MKQILTVSPSPHIRDGLDIRGVMYAVVVALLPAAAGSVYFFGMKALLIISITCLSAILTEAVCQRAIKRPITIADGSALVTGMLLAFNLPPGVPYWLPVVGAAFAIGIAKIPFGGLGYNPLNPALAARAFLMASWPAYMTAAWAAPSRGSLSGISGTNAITTATPLGVFKTANQVLGDPSASLQSVALAKDNLKYLYSTDSLKNLFFGNRGGCIGETSVLLLVIGAAYLLLRRIICWRIPVSYVATVGLLGWIMGGQGLLHGNALFQVLSGGLILGAFFMATDMVTSPVTPRGKLIFGFGCGIITSVIRLKGGYPEGVSYSILIMNITVPLIDKFTRPRILGEVKPAK
ncbi:MAG: RnfABCDGE type electron transport complex subunit D [Candidatus Eisenbacteria bacterium]